MTKTDEPPGLIYYPKANATKHLEAERQQSEDARRREEATAKEEAKVNEARAERETMVELGRQQVAELQRLKTEMKAREEKAREERRIREEREKERELELTRLREELEATKGAVAIAARGAFREECQAQMQRGQIQQQGWTVQQQVAVERRWDNRGWYTFQEFVDQLGPVQGQNRWQVAPRWQGR